ncbi:MAG: competence/damage-inducible protein A [Candidatus Omnitrophica bacterium CG11_big_fil_rev_8_21_14_0_20_64_10]|nr:MAG: competence/damage-inducible protein A [Candidatus Omnitrophica bacterium CG11_big_fil_rev_8_21_14_0_20_64_10]
MTAEIIAIGTELLLGFVLNSNTVALSRALSELGISCLRQTTIGDNPARLEEGLRTALARSEIVITCGGLGPTVDDVTREAITAATGRPLCLNRPLLKQVERRFTRYGHRMPDASRRQAFLPEGALPFPNEVGTAPGIWLIHSRRPLKVVVALPGPPREMLPMLRERLIPALKKLRGGGEVILSREIKITGLDEPAVDRKVRDLLRLSGSATVGIYASPGQVLLRITARSASAAAARRTIAPIERTIRKRFGRTVFGSDAETLEGATVAALKRRRKTVAVAESCTGGGLGQRITGVSGASDVFLGGVIAYHNRIKEKHLGVSAAILKRHGAVSAPVARAMALGVRRMTGADYGVAVTGIAGPTGGSKGKPVGLVFIAWAGPAGCRVRKFRFAGDRPAVRFRATQRALDQLRLMPA